KEYYLESDIIATMERFCNTRVGDVEVTRVTPKLRQQVYVALGTRGFSDIKRYKRFENLSPAKVLPVYVVGRKIKKTINGTKSAENNQLDQEESNDKNDKSPPHQFYSDESDYYYPTEATNDGTYY
ncbi:9813_t:CDS:2, partial [Funneliformis caledonium]